RRLGANSGHVIVFYLVSAVIVGLCTPLTVLLATGGDPLTLILGAAALAAAILLIARMLGRVACLARLADLRPKKRKRQRRRARGVQVSDPWEVPEETETAAENVEGEPVDSQSKPRFIQPRDLPALHTPYDGDITGYDVKFETRPAEPPRAARKQAH